MNLSMSEIEKMSEENSENWLENKLNKKLLNISTKSKKHIPKSDISIIQVLICKNILKEVN